MSKINLRDLKGHDVKVIFDNGGGISLQLGDFKHYYANEKQAAEDYYNFFDCDFDTHDWEGNDLDVNMDYEGTCPNGGYTVLDENEVADLVEKVISYGQDYDEDEVFWGYNQQHFIEALVQLMSEEE